MARPKATSVTPHPLYTGRRGGPDTSPSSATARAPCTAPAPAVSPREHGTRDERTTTQGRTTFVTSERDSLLPEPRSERDLPAHQARAPGGGGRAPLRAASYHQPRHLRTRLGHLPGRTALHLHSAAAARLGCGGTSDPGSGPCHQRPWPRPGPLDHRPPRCGGLDVERHGAHRGVATELALKAAPRGRAQQGRRRCG